MPMKSQPGALPLFPARHAAALFCALALALTLLPCSAPSPARAEAAVTEPATLTVGDKGPAVRAAKERFYALGYYQKKNFTQVYTEDFAEIVRTFQRLSGLPETGELDAATSAALYAETAVRCPHPTMPPLATDVPTPVPDWPERDAEGFLAGEGEYFYENDEEGLWLYLSARLRIVIRHRRDATIPLEWFETDIWTRDGESLRTVATDPAHPGKKYQYPYVIARSEGFVLGFSDDFYATRMAEKQTVGIIIREGQVFSSATHRKRGHHLPNLDMMAQYPDGRLAVYTCNERTAEELLAEGAVNVFSFGPILIRDGVIDELLYGSAYKSIEPRQALGMITPHHYFLLSVQGRTADSRGTTLQRMAEMMKAHGVTDALNLDGGNTMALVFRGRMLNKLATYQNRKFVRTVTSLIGIGYTENTEK